MGDPAQAYQYSMWEVDAGPTGQAEGRLIPRPGMRKEFPASTALGRRECIREAFISPTPEGTAVLR